MNESKTQEGLGMLKASREPYWEECPVEEQIRRLRDHVARLARDMQQAQEIILKLSSHQHSSDGSPMTPMYVGFGSNQAIQGSYAHDGGIPHDLRTARERR